MSNFVLITKDAMCRDYIPIYGNRYFATPNLDDLARKGTVFLNHYTSAPSTVMSFFGMATGIWAHDTEYEMYEKVCHSYSGETLFTKLSDSGYDCHIIWDPAWDVLLKYVDYFDKVQIHSMAGFRQAVGAHYAHQGFLQEDKEAENATFLMVEEKVKTLLLSEKDTFLWIHFPHVINGKVAYGSDIELFDRYVGMIRNYVADDCIAVSADHGNMNGHKNKLGYGFDVYDPAIRLPFITPRIDGLQTYEGNTSNIDLFDILFYKKIPEREFVYSDSAYRAQRHRKLAILWGKYKYIYNKESNTEELYDLEYDPNEEFSLIEDYNFDVDRKVKAPSRELFFYPHWERLPEIRAKLRKEKVRVWKNGSLAVILKSDMKDLLRPAYAKLSSFIHKVKSTERKPKNI